MDLPGISAAGCCFSKETERKGIWDIITKNRNESVNKGNSGGNSETVLPRIPEAGMTCEDRKPNILRRI